MKKVLLSLIAITTFNTQCFSFKDIRNLFTPSKEQMIPTCFPQPITYSHDEAVVLKAELLKEQEEKLSANTNLYEEICAAHNDPFSQNLTIEQKKIRDLYLQLYAQIAEERIAEAQDRLTVIRQLPAQEVAEQFSLYSADFPKTLIFLKKRRKEEVNLMFQQVIFYPF